MSKGKHSNSQKERENNNQLNQEKLNNNSKPKNKFSKSIIIIIEIILFGIMIFSGIQIYNWFNENNQSKEILNIVQEAISIDEEKEDIDIEKYSIDFDELKETNPKTVAWLKVNGTDIEYPIVQASDNSYYLTHSFDNNYNSAGWPFADYKNKFDGTDKNIIVYGHNRKDGSMFGTLKNIYTEEWYNDLNNRKILFYTEDDESIYEIFSCYTVQDEDYYIQTSFKGNFGKFIDTLKNRSEREFDIDVDENDHILTLSTCGAGNTRVVIHAKKVIENMQEE